MEILNFTEQDAFIPDRIYWESLLGKLERCSSDVEVEHTAIEISKTLKPLQPRKKNVRFRCNVDFIDAASTEAIPDDGPQDVHAIKIPGDRNCLCRSVSYSYSGDNSMHIEMRLRIIVEGVIHKDKYMSNTYLVKGLSIDRAEPLPYLYVQYSDYYVNGQRITDNTVEYIYSRELHDCSKMNSYMGLWQMAQAASVINIPIKSVYPMGGDDIM